MTVAQRLELIRAICRFERRRSGTDSERRAANELAERLRAAGRRATVEPTYVHPQLGFVLSLHCVAAIVASLLAILLPAVGFALVLLVGASLYLDLNTRFYLLRRLLFRRASQNVVSPGADPEAPARLILCAHIDAGRSGAIYRARSARGAARLARLLRVPVGPLRPMFVVLTGLLVPLAARMAGIEAAWVDVVQLALIVALLFAVFLLVDIELSGSGPGANDNASGVATVMSLAGTLDDEPPETLDVWVLLTGAEEPIQEGMRAFVRAHRNELDRATTYFVNVDAVGRGAVRYEIRAGWLVSYAMGERLAELAEAISTAERERVEVEAATPHARSRAGAPDRESRPTENDVSSYALPLRRGTAGDSLPPRLAGYDAITITCRDELGLVPDLRSFADVPDEIDTDALEKAHAFILELVRQLDRDVRRHSSASRNTDAAT